MSERIFGLFQCSKNIQWNVGELRQTLKAWCHLSTPKTLFLRVLYHQVLVEATKFSFCTINFDKEMQSNFATSKQNFYIHSFIKVFLKLTMMLYWESKIPSSRLKNLKIALICLNLTGLYIIKILKTRTYNFFSVLPSYCHTSERWKMKFGPSTTSKAKEICHFHSILQVSLLLNPSLMTQTKK